MKLVSSQVSPRYKYGKLTNTLSAIIRAYGEPPNNWSEQETREQVLDLLDKRNLSNYSEVDLDSIMM